MKEKKFFIFDWDGVLVDSTNLSCQKIQLILERLGLPGVPNSFLLNIWGKKMSEIFDIIGVEVGATSEQVQKMKEMEPLVSKELPYKFERELFEALSNLRLFGLLTGILTNRSNRSLQEIAQQTGVSLNLFDKIQTTDHWPHSKPSGRSFGPFINFARSRGIQPQKIIYFGDTIAQDLAAARYAEPPIDFIGVVSGINTREEFMAAEVPLCRIVDFKNLPMFLHQTISQMVES